MADLGFKDYLINFLLIGLFVIGLVYFGVSLGTSYGVNNQGDGGVNYSRLEQTMNDTNADAEGWKNTFTSDNPVISIGGMVLVGIWLIVKSMFVIPYTILTVLLDGVVSVLGIPPLAVGVIITILIISLVYSAYRIIKLGW